MRESLCDSSLVNEKPARRQHSRDLAQRYPRPLCASAHMVARSEIDYRVERSTEKGQLPEVSLSQANGRSPRSCPSRLSQEICVNVDAC